MFVYSSVQGWRRIARAVNADSTVAKRCMYDVLNEPDAFGVRFEPRDRRPGMKDLYFSAFDAIYEVNPGMLTLSQCVRRQSVTIFSKRTNCFAVFTIHF